MRIEWLLSALLALPAALTPAPQRDGLIVNLYDAFGKAPNGTELAWGYSALVRFHGKTILFDSGGDADRFERNTKALGVDLKSVDYAVLSHSHGDHASGFDYALKVNPALKIYMPDDISLGGGTGLALPAVPKDVLDALPPESRYFNGEPRTTSGPWGTRYWRARTEIVAADKEVAPGVFLISTRSTSIGNFTRPRPDEAPVLTGIPELSLALVTSDGVVLVTGCSHSGIETIVRKTRQTAGKDIQLVVGGFHLLPYNASEIRQLAARMKEELGVRQAAPAHCTGMLAFQIFREVFGKDYVAAGLGSEVKFVQ
jgi:7,8-dihydropterin-6-yl-methyl-4-(beta-D-ribofuranosyl)aminobenzene 5'-phosphate synthase